MQITNNINSNNIRTQNFNGIYRIKKANSGLVDEIQTTVKPLYESVKRRAVIAFYGDNPADLPLVSALDKITKTENTSYNWLVQNAKNHGIKFVDKNNCNVWVFTGDDIGVVTDTLGYASHEFEKPNLFFKFKLLKDMVFGKFKDVPEHLKEYLCITEKNKKFTSYFQERIKNKEVVEVDNIHDLIYKMFLEK